MPLKTPAPGATKMGLLRLGLVLRGAALMGAACFWILLATSPAAVAGDPKRGAELFNTDCSYCHALSARVGHTLAVPRPHFDTERIPGRRPEVDWPIEQGQDKRGPHLEGLFTRAPGAVKGFPYRITMQTENPVWTEEDLDYWILNHAQIGAADRADLIAYLKQATGG